jgi:hypothetical protein
MARNCSIVFFEDLIKKDMIAMEEAEERTW